MINRIKIWLLDLIIAPYVECSNCKALCEYGKEAKTCWACKAEVVINDDTPVLLSLVQRSARGRPYTAYVRCPNCRRLLNHGTDYCQHCREELNEEYAFVSWFTEVLKTTACDQARTIAGFDAYATIVAVLSVALFGFSVATREIGVSYLIPFTSIPPLTVVLLWFYRFGAIDDDDKEYLHAKCEVKQALKLWLLLFAAQVFVLFLLIFPH